MKNFVRGLALGATAALLAGATTYSATAQIHTEKTNFTLTEPMDVGGFVLEPGSYRLKVVVLSDNRIHIFTATGRRVQTFGASVGTGPNAVSGFSGIAVDPDNGNIFIVDPVTTASRYSVRYHPVDGAAAGSLSSTR